MIFNPCQSGQRDYKLLTNQLILEKEESEQTIEIEISGDDVAEETEVFRVRIFVLEQPVTVEISIEEAMVVIEDRDGRCKQIQCFQW